MARGQAKLLFSLYFCKNSLGRNLIPRCKFHLRAVESSLCRNSSQVSAQPWPRVPIFTMFGAFPDSHRHWFCTLSENEKPVLVSEESIQPARGEGRIPGSETQIVGGQEDDFSNRDPVRIYKELKDTLHCQKKSGAHSDALNEILSFFTKSSWATNQALAIYISGSFFPLAASKFSGFLVKRSSNDLVNYLVSLGQGDKSDRFLLPIFVEFCLDEFPDDISRFRKMVDSADMTRPHTWFPFARAMKRKIIYHCGPTNSGKTYNALQRFMEAKKGVYCSPLRLLAMEVFDKVNGLGVYCSLLTGQEKKDFPFSNHVACTVEMVSTDELYDVAVIDEIQMMADSCRGYAWTRALLGLKADEIHLCGDPSVLNVVRRICSDTGDELVEQHYERFKPLVVEGKTLFGDLKYVKSGDCIEEGNI